MLTTSSRARMPAVWTRHTSNVSRLSCPTSDNSAASRTGVAVAFGAGCVSTGNGLVRRHASTAPLAGAWSGHRVAGLVHRGCVAAAGQRASDVVGFEFGYCVFGQQAAAAVVSHPDRSGYCV